MTSFSRLARTADVTVMCLQLFFLPPGGFISEYSWKRNPLKVQGEVALFSAYCLIVFSWSVFTKLVCNWPVKNLWVKTKVYREQLYFSYILETQYSCLPQRSSLNEITFFSIVDVSLFCNRKIHFLISAFFPFPQMCCDPVKTVQFNYINSSKSSVECLHFLWVSIPVKFSTCKTWGLSVTIFTHKFRSKYFAILFADIPYQNI